jgi:glycosyltransferase involved in cell wall biosynthesis
MTTQPTVALAHSELKSAYQRGIYLYAKSLFSALEARGFPGLLLTDFRLADQSNLTATKLAELIGKPPLIKIRSLQMVPQYLRHQWLGQMQVSQRLSTQDVTSELTERNSFLTDLDHMLNVENLYELCRLAASKPGFSPVDMDFLREQGADVVLTTAPLAIQAKRKRLPIIQSVMDLIVLNTEVHSTDVDKYRRRLEAAIFNADAILAISEYTKNEIIERYPGVADRIKVIHLPIPADDAVVATSALPEVRAETLQRHGLASGGYIFYVGAIEARKNIARLIKAHKQSKVAREFPLVLAGVLDEKYLKAEGVHEHFLPAAQSHSAGSRSVRYLGRISELDKLCLLRDARCFAFPSITEGFGIPALEAQSMGCPVLTTNASAIPEVVGKTAVMIEDPTNLDELSNALDRITGEAVLASELSVSGLQNSKRFAKDIFADQVAALIRSVA